MGQIGRISGDNLAVVFPGPESDTIVTYKTALLDLIDVLSGICPDNSENL